MFFLNGYYFLTFYQMRMSAKSFKPEPLIFLLPNLHKS
jgi:hypothetical protein